MKNGLPEVGDKLIHSTWGECSIIRIKVVNDFSNKLLYEVDSAAAYKLISLYEILPMIHAYSESQKVMLEERPYITSKEIDFLDDLNVWLQHQGMSKDFTIMSQFYNLIMGLIIRRNILLKDQSGNHEE